MIAAHMGQKTPPLKTIQRAFEILDVLKEEKTVGVSELSRRMDLPKSTVHDYLRTLKATGYVVNDGGTYSLGFRLLELGGHVKYRNRLFHTAKPELERQLRRRESWPASTSRSTVDSSSFTLSTVRSRSSSASTRDVDPIHTHAAGKVMLANFAEEKVDRILDEHGLDQVTEHTVTDRHELVAELETIRERGYGVDRNQQVVGMSVVDSGIGLVSVSIQTVIRGIDRWVRLVLCDEPWTEFRVQPRRRGIHRPS